MDTLAELGGMLTFIGLIQLILTYAYSRFRFETSVMKKIYIIDRYKWEKEKNFKGAEEDLKVYNEKSFDKNSTLKEQQIDIK